MLDSYTITHHPKVCSDKILLGTLATAVLNKWSLPFKSFSSTFKGCEFQRRNTRTFHDFLRKLWFAAILLVQFTETTVGNNCYRIMFAHLLCTIGTAGSMQRKERRIYLHVHSWRVIFSPNRLGRFGLMLWHDEIITGVHSSVSDILARYTACLLYTSDAADE